MAGQSTTDLLPLIGQSIVGGVTASRRKRDAAKEKAERMKLIQGLDWEPMYASQIMPTYQKAQSPIARSYLESMLMGANPDQIASNSPGAAVQKSIAQMKQNATWGTPQERVAQQREADAATPWKVTPPTRKVVEGNKQNENALWQQQGKGLTNAGITKDFNTWANDNLKMDTFLDNDLQFQAQLVKRFGTPEAAMDAVNKRDPAALDVMRKNKVTFNTHSVTPTRVR